MREEGVRDVGETEGVRSVGEISKLSMDCDRFSH